MKPDQPLLWREGPFKDHVLYANTEQVAQVFPRDNGKPGFTLCVRNHGEWWGQVPASQHQTLEQAKFYGKKHGGEYFRQQERDFAEMGQHFKNTQKLGQAWERNAAKEDPMMKEVFGHAQDQGHER